MVICFLWLYIKSSLSYNHATMQPLTRSSILCQTTSTVPLKFAVWIPTIILILKYWFLTWYIIYRFADAGAGITEHQNKAQSNFGELICLCVMRLHLNWQFFKPKTHRLRCCVIRFLSIKNVLYGTVISMHTNNKSYLFNCFTLFIFGV